MQDHGRKPGFSSIYLALTVSLIGAAVCLIWPHPFENLDFRFYDLKVAIRDPGPVLESIVHLDVDDKAVSEFGIWPWDREMSARIVNRLAEAGAALVVFDVLYAAKGNRPEGNEAFFKALSASGRVVSATAMGITDSAEVRPEFTGDSARIDALYERAWPLDLPENSRFFEVSRLSDSLVPLAPVIKNSKEVGHIKSNADPDAVHRRVGLLVRYRDKCVPSLGLAAAAAHLSVIPKNIVVTDTEIKLKHDRGMTSIPVDEHGRMRIDWHEPWQRFPKGFRHYSVSDLLAPEADASNLQEYKDKIVVVGVTWTGSTDLGVCPLAKDCPLSRVHSNALNTILTGNFIRSIHSFPFIMGLAVILSIGFAFAAPRVRMLYAVLLFTALITLYVLFSIVAFIKALVRNPHCRPYFCFHYDRFRITDNQGDQHRNRVFSNC